MKIPFSEITAGGISKIVMDTGWSSNSGLVFSKRPEAEISLRLTDDITVQLAGRIIATVDGECGRCGTSIDFEVDEKFVYLFRLEEDDAVNQADFEVSNEDSETVFVEEPVVNLDEVLAEQLVLAVPVKLLCSENCKGLCPKCGIALNLEQCNCAQEMINSPFAILKKLKK